MKKYIKKFRQGRGAIGVNAIDFYEEHGKTIKISWGMGGETKEEVNSVQDKIEGYILIET